ncbi:MAG: spore coat protein U domain-containing protein [Mariprofundaceae bacterium]|nr:spore coat protein U domain-containing protein [Mariprofundaceae bacterium]
MNIKKSIFTASLLLATALPMQSQAAIATGQINVTATTVAITANIVVAGSIAFGTSADTATAIAQSSFDVTVTNGIPYTINMDGGANFNVATNKSFLKDGAGANAREYILYQNLAKTVIWGPAGVVKTGLNGTAVAQTYNVYGKLLASPGTAGAITDIVTVTVTY